MAAATKGLDRGRLTHTEVSALDARRLDSFYKGEVFVREGTPCMMLEAPVGSTLTEGHRLIANLTNGSAWPAKGNDMVFPVIDVHLTFASGR